MRGFTDEEAHAILTATLVLPNERTSATWAAAKRWIPWLAAYTGARVSELTQLRACDAGEIDGVWVISITPAAGTVKQSWMRNVPIHEHLVAQGFLDFA